MFSGIQVQDSHGLGIKLSLGIEYALVKNGSLRAALTRYNKALPFLFAMFSWIGRLNSALSSLSIGRGLGRLGALLRSCPPAPACGWRLLL